MPWNESQVPTFCEIDDKGGPQVITRYGSRTPKIDEEKNQSVSKTKGARPPQETLLDKVARDQKQPHTNTSTIPKTDTYIEFCKNNQFCRVQQDGTATTCIAFEYHILMPVILQGHV